jgi:hypothetical protein
MRLWGGAVLAVVWTVSAVQASEGPALLCAPATVRKTASAAVDLSVTDRFATRAVTVAKLSALCWSEAPSTDLLAGYAARTRPRRARRLGTQLALVTRFGTERLSAKTFTGVLVPSSEGTETPDAAPRACYAARGESLGRRPRVAVTDSTGERLFDVGRAVRLCVATTGEDVPDLVCHAIRLARTKPLRQARSRRGDVTLTNRFGGGALRVGEPRELCVAVLGEAPPPPPAVTLEVLPQAVTVLAGSRAKLTATAHYEDGHAADVTGSVVWTSSDEGVARIVGASPAGAFITGVGPGTATISVADPATGATSHGGGDATVEVTWPLEKLTIDPHAVSLLPGEHEGYTVTGHFTGGTTRNLTQRVVYASSNPAVAIATNQAGNRSRVQAVAPGTTVISATDPISGITTTDASNDATLRVVGGLSYIVVQTGTYNQTLPVGKSKRFTATGYFADGSNLNLTQRCQWSSSNPSVAAAPNTPGDRSRIDALSPGYTTISCFEPISGKWSYEAALWALGPMESIWVGKYLWPGQYPRTGQSVTLKAFATYEGGGQRYVTQEVVWDTRDPDLLFCPNEPGNRGRVVALAGGNARVFATDPATGVVSNDATIPVLGTLVGLEVVGPYFYRGWDVIPVDAYAVYSVLGIFENGTLNLSFRKDYELASTDPGIAEVVDNRWVRGVSPGTTTLTARDVATGITSPPIEVKVAGALESITLTPATATRGIGEWESFTAIGHYPPGYTRNMTQDLSYTSSDPTVAVADNAFHDRSRIRTIGAGTTTISVDGGNGITASAVLTVLPGTIERVTIEPSHVVRNVGNAFSYTAIGHYPDGSTINVTQVVKWDTLVPDVATATNEAGNRSRVRAIGLGVTGVTARHPSGVSSHDTGDDATFEVKPIVGLSLSPAAHVGPVGMIEKYTLIGTFDDASTINLTQDAYYWTDDAAVARADNPDGDRSAVLLVAPGTTAVHAAFADWSSGEPVIDGSVAGAFLTVDP